MRSAILSQALALIAGIALSALPGRAADRDKWIEVRSPNFIVVSDGSEADARKVAQQFEQVRALFRDSLVYARSHPSPVITILAAKDENSLRELLPEYWETKGHTHPAGIFLNNYNQFQVAINLDTHGDNPYEAIYHEYYHSVTTPYFSGLPLWVVEGMADFYGNTEINDKNANMGMPNFGLIELLKSQSMLPLSTLFAVDYSSPYYNEQNKATIFYAESWALIHYLMIGDHMAHNKEFGDFLAALDKGATPQQAVAAFGDPGKLQADLERYVHTLVFTSVLFPAPARIAAKDLPARMLSDAESDAYRGGFLALHQQFKDAQPLLEEAARLDAKLALAQQNLGVLHYAQQQGDALASLSAAIALDPNNAYTRYLRAKVNFDSGSTTKLSDAEADLRQAIAINPDFAPPYGLLALCLAPHEDKLPEALALAQKGASLEPGRMEYQFDLAQVLMRMHRFDEAETTARHLLLQTTDPSQQSQVNSVLYSIQQARQFDARRAQQQQQLAEEAAARNSAATSSGPAETDRADDGIARSETAPTNVEPLPPDHRIRGLATEVVCRGNDMRVTVKTEDSSVMLHVTDASKVDYTSYVLVRPGVISPCDDLKGRTVRVTTKDGTPAGEITALDIMK